MRHGLGRLSKASLRCTVAVRDRVVRYAQGATLLRAVFALAHQMARDYGCVGVLVDAKSEAIAYYKRFGFVELSTLRGELGDRPAPAILFLELGAIPRISEPPPVD